MTSSTTVGMPMLNKRERISHRAIAGDPATYHTDQHCNISTQSAIEVLRVSDSEAWLWVKSGLI